MNQQPKALFTTKANLIVTLCTTAFALVCFVLLAGGDPGSNMPDNPGANLLGIMVSVAYMPYVVAFRRNMSKNQTPGSPSYGFRALNLPITLAGIALNGILALFNAYAVLGSFALGA